MPMSSKLAHAVALAALIAAVAAPPALAGWKIEEVDPAFPKEVTTYWFQGGKARVEGALEGLTVLVDLRAQEGWLFDPATRRFAGGKIAELAEQLRKLEIEPPGDEDAAAGEGEREPEGEAPAGARTVTIKDLGAGERILGYDTRHYQVLVDGEVLEEVLMAPKVDVEREADLAGFVTAMQKMLGGGAGMNQGYEGDAGYLKLRSAGYPLRQTLFFVGEKSVLEVKSVELKALPDADFAVPKGYAQVGYAELLVGEGGK
jgi:hypothetical protein